MLTAKTLFKKKLTKLLIIPLLVVVAVMVSPTTASAATGDADSFLKGRSVSGYSDLDGFYALLVGSANGGLSGFVGCQPGDKNGLSTKYNTLMSDFMNDLSSPDSSKIADFKTKALQTLQNIRSEYKGGIPADNEICNDIASYAITNGISYGSTVPTGSDAARLDTADGIAKICAASLQRDGINGASDTETLILSLSDADYKTVNALFSADEGGSSCGSIAVFLSQHKPDLARQQLNTLCMGKPDDLAMIGKLTTDQEAEALKISTGTCSSIESYLQQVTGDAGADEGDASTGCSFSVNPLTWIACPVVGILEEAVRGIDNFITSALTINVDTVFDTSSGYYKAWSSFRILATAIIIIAGIVMVASQALGFEFLDAYTIRKVLPRLLIAIIGISLSWPIMKFVVDFFNTLGYDIRNLIYSPFGNMGLNTLNAGTLLAVNGAILGTLFVMGIGATLSLLLTAALAILIGFLIIIVRDMAIIVLIIVAPIALACYILPNTQKVWKLWSTNFMGLMMMFPIISAFIAVGKVFSAVSLNPQGSDSAAWGSGTVMQIVGFLAYFIPYFLLPIAFRLATGVIGSIAGFVNDRNRGIFDRLKKGRQTRMADRMGRARSNNLWDNNSRLGRLGNKIAGGITDPLDTAAYYGRNRIPGLSKRGHRIASTIEGAAVEQSGKLAEEINKMGFNDKGLRALTGVHSGMSEGVQAALRAEGLYGKAPKSLPQLKRMAEILAAHGDGAEQNAANAVEGSMGRLATLYQDPEMGKASVAAAGAMMLAQHGFLTPKDIPQLGDVLTAQGGTSFAQSVISQAAMIGQRSRPDLKNGYGWMYDKTANNGKGGFVDGIHDGGPGGKRDLALIASTSSHDVAGAKGGYMDDMKDTYNEILTTARTDTTYEQASTLKRTLSPEAWKAQPADVKRKAQAYDMYDAIKDQLFQWAGPYSQASGDVKTKSIDFIDSFGLRNEFEQTKRTNMSPEQLDAMRAAGQNPEAQGQQGPGGGPGGPGH